MLNKVCDEPGTRAAKVHLSWNWTRDLQVPFMVNLGVQAAEMSLCGVQLGLEDEAV